MKASAVILVVALTGTATARADDERRYALVVGYNGRPAQVSESNLPVLRYADDDALAFYELEQELGGQPTLLTIPDSETRARYPDAARIARPPSIAELSRVITSLNERMDADLQAGRTPVLTFYFSGHGARDEEGRASLTFLDGPLSQSSLYSKVLDQVHAKVVHLVIDACHAEAVVRPRDVDAAGAAPSSSEIVAHLSQTTLARYPHVGVVIAGNSSAQTHEWEVYQSGVFTHEVISALRGGADVNHDDQVEYSELAAFLAAANRGVADPRAKPNSIVRPPLTEVHAPLVRLTGQRPVARLTGIPAAAGEFFVEDLHGNRLVDGRAEPGFTISLLLPAGQPLFFKRNQQEAELLLRPGDRLDFGSLSFRQRALTARGAVESSFRAGLFVTPFGPAYYRGYIDRSDAVPVSDDNPIDLALPAGVDTPPTEARPRATWLLGGAAGAFGATSAVFSFLAWDAYRDYDQTDLEQPAKSAAARFKTASAVAVTLLLSAAACAVASWVVGRAP